MTLHWICNSIQSWNWIELHWICTQVLLVQRSIVDKMTLNKLFSMNLHTGHTSLHQCSCKDIIPLPSYVHILIMEDIVKECCSDRVLCKYIQKCKLTQDVRWQPIAHALNPLYPSLTYVHCIILTSMRLCYRIYWMKSLCMYFFYFHFNCINMRLKYIQHKLISG